MTDSRGAGTPDWARVNEIFHQAILANHNLSVGPLVREAFNAIDG